MLSTICSHVDVCWCQYLTFISTPTNFKKGVSLVFEAYRFPGTLVFSPTSAKIPLFLFSPKKIFLLISEWERKIEMMRKNH